MNREFLNHLLSKIAQSRYINLFFKDIELNDKLPIQALVPEIHRSYYGNIFVDVDIRVFNACKNESQEAETLLQIINNNPSARENNISIANAISITDTLDRLNITLGRPGLIVFHCFEDNCSEREKDTLRAIRRFLNVLKIEENIPRLLGILIISNDRIDRWELFPESNLDGRYVLFSHAFKSEVE